MKRLSAALLAGLLLASSLPALADSRDRGHGRGFQPDRYERYDHRSHRDRHNHHRDYRHNHGNAVLGVLGAGLVLGAIALASEPHRPPPAPVVVVPVRPSAGVWHYCASAGTYYPYTETCPEGWRAVVP
jgi:hypothetical protein